MAENHFEVEEYARALYAAAQQVAQAKADADPLRQTRRDQRGTLQPVVVEIQTWERLSPPVRTRWLAKAAADILATKRALEAEKPVDHAARGA